jgi:D-inositol-3-phosphate glycosyltransferase
VVASAVGGLLDLVVHEETGLLVPPRDVAALRSALERLIGNPDLRRSFGAAARSRIREHFSWDRFVQETVQAYEDALAKG